MLPIKHKNRQKDQENIRRTKRNRKRRFRMCLQGSEQANEGRTRNKNPRYK